MRSGGLAARSDGDCALVGHQRAAGLHRFFSDPNFQWHHRVLVEKLDKAGRWVCATPDLECEVVDLNNHRVVAVARAATFPRRVQGNVYAFSGLSDAEYDQVRAEARALAAVLGAASAAAAPDALWVYADMAMDEFGTEVDASIVQDANKFVSRPPAALVRFEDTWTYAERVQRRDLEAWLEKRTRPGRDARVLPLTRDSRDQRYIGLREAMSEMKQVTQADTPFRGPSASVELLDTVRGSGEELAGYHEYYLRHSGLDSSSAVAHTHRTLLNIAAHLVSFDQLNVLALAGFEMLARHVLRIHRAVKKSPKAPNFQGLEIMVASKLDTGGLALTGEFAKWTAEEQKSEAFTMKQQRLYAEESSKRPGEAAGGKK